MTEVGTVCAFAVSFFNRDLSSAQIASARYVFVIV